MVNLDEDFEEVSNTLPKGLLYSKETGLIIQSEVDGVEKALYITPEHLSKNEDSLFNEEGKINADFMSDGILPSGLSFEKGILKIGNGNQYGGLIVNNLMAITSLPIGEEDGTGKNMYLLENGQNYYFATQTIPKEDPSDTNYTSFVINVRDDGKYVNNTYGFLFEKVPFSGEEPWYHGMNARLVQLLNDSYTIDFRYVRITGGDGAYGQSQSHTYPIEIGDGTHPIAGENVEVSFASGFFLDHYYTQMGGVPPHEIGTYLVEHLRRINNHAFEGMKLTKGCGRAEENFINYFGVSAFKDNSSLQDVSIMPIEDSEKNNTIIIGSYCFQNCTSLSIIYTHFNDLGSKEYGGIEVNEYAFQNCANLIGFFDSHNNKFIEDTTKSIYLTKIGRGSFQNCTSLEEISLECLENSTFTTFEESVFEKCSNLREIHFTSPSESVLPPITTFKEHAFDDCTSLKGFSYTYLNSDNTASTSYLPLNNVQTIGDYCFYNNYALEIPNFPSSIISIGEYAFSNCRKLREITLNDNITSIGKYAFRGCDNAVIQHIPKNNTYTLIQEATFDSCNFELDEIPENITEIESGAFNNGYGRISSIKSSSIILRNGSFTFMEFTEDIDATAVQNITIEDNAFRDALGKIKVNSNVFQQLVSSGRAIPKGQEGSYYIDSEDFIIEKVEI